MEVLNNIINFALIKSKTVRQPLGLTRTFDFVRMIFALIKSKTVRQPLGLTRTFDFVRIYLHSSNQKQFHYGKRKEDLQNSQGNPLSDS